MGHGRLGPGVAGTVACLALCACSHAPRSSGIASAQIGETERSGQAPDGRDDAEIVVDVALVKAEPEEVIAAWLLYAGGKKALWEARTPKRSDQAADDFVLERIARSALADTWERDRSTGTAPNAELDMLVALEKEGLIDPFLLMYWALPGWTVPPEVLAAIDFPRFRRWADTHLVGHVPVRHVLFKPRDGLTFPKIPGADLPAPATFDPKRVPCARSRDVIQRAIQQWTREAAVLQGAPLAARDRGALVRDLEKVRGVAPYSERGVTWVDHKVHVLHQVAGYCAVDAGQWVEAEKMLRMAIALLPSDGLSHGELAQVYIHTHRLDDADGMLEEALALAPNRCERARVMRAQGFVQVERGKLLEAYQLYGRSLELDPGSPVAKRELAFIDGELRSRGSAKATKLAPSPAPTSPTKVEASVTSCPQ